MDQTRPTRVYLAGPMRGLPEFNFPAFFDAEADLARRGFNVWNPARADVELDGFDPEVDEPRPFAFYMARDLPAVCESDAVVVLPGWQQSQGARLEVRVAREIGLPVVRYPDLTPARHPGSDRFHELLAVAGELHDRKQADYGSGNDPFANVRASSAWGIPPWVGAMVRLNDKVNRLQSFARKGFLANESAFDSLQDIAVYALIAYVLLEEELSAMPQPMEQNEARHDQEEAEAGEPELVGEQPGVVEDAQEQIREEW